MKKKENYAIYLAYICNGLAHLG